MRKQAKTVTMNVINVAAVILLMTVLAACAGSAGNGDGNGDVDGDTGLCGEHQHLEGGVCTCDTGFVPSEDGGKCVAAPDGDSDKDNANPEKDSDDTVTDGDDSDGDDSDGDTSDGDDVESDGDAEPDDDQLCTCPIIDDEYCVDPEVAGSVYKRVVVSPGSVPGCSLHVVVYDELHAAFSGGLTCNEEGRALLAALGCTLNYDLVDEEISLICGAEIYNFRHAWCTVIDGDYEEPVDGDEEDFEPDSDPDAEPDVSEIDPDDEPDVNPDGDDVIDGDFDGVITCDDHGDCPSTHFCFIVGNVCVPDVCNVAAGMLCPMGFECDQWGQCVMGGGSDGDVDYADNADPDADTGLVCQDDEGCPEHFRCLDHKCQEGCTSDMQCPPDFFCGFHGNCIFAGGDEDSDYEFENGCDCMILNEETGEDTCATGTYCNSACQCVFDCKEGVVGCQTEFGCFCNDKGRCECPEPECDSDYACPSGEFCNLLNICEPGCPSVACPDGMYCADNHGHCDYGIPDGDTDQSTSIPCPLGNECPVGYYCGTAKFCTYDCQVNTDCTEGFVCDLTGQCVPDTAVCNTHEDCGAGYYCGSDNDCHQDCSNDDWCHEHYDPTYSCNGHGYCEILPVDGDAVDGDSNAWPYCDQDSDCSQNAFYYCNVAEHTCTQGVCTNSNQCNSGYYCTLYGKCEQIPDWDPDEGQVPGWCDSDDDCPAFAGAYPPGQYCGTDNQCHFDCFYGAEDDGCDPGEYCDENGRCQLCGGDADCGSEKTYCDEYGECPVGMHCDSTSGEDLCVSECPCESPQVCDTLGYCILIPTDGDVDPDDDVSDHDAPGVLCSGPADCPLGTYCDMSMDVPECSVDCFRDEDCSIGYYCNCRGQCHSNPDFSDCLPALYCTAQWQCPYNTPCESALGGQYCYTHCLSPAIGCEANQQCDSLTGYCIDLPVDGDVEIGDPDEELEPEEEVFGCFTDEDCPSDMYCGNYNICEKDCTPERSLNACSTPDDECPGAQVCSERGRCVTPDISCTMDDHCPKGSYCLTLGGTNICLKGCSLDVDCGSGKVCDVSHSKCVDPGNEDPNPVYPSCVTDCNCPVFSRCEGGYCVTDCIGDRGCNSGEYCSFTGTCEVEVDGDTDGGDADSEEPYDCKPVIPCTSDVYCPYHSKCNIAENRCEGFCTFDSHCQNGKVCTDTGECVTPPYSWDGSGHDLVTGCENDSQCPKGTYCWTEGNICRIDCVCGDGAGLPDELSCETGYYCDYDRGRCVASGGK